MVARGELWRVLICQRLTKYEDHYRGWRFEVASKRR